MLITFVMAFHIAGTDQMNIQKLVQDHFKSGKIGFQILLGKLLKISSSLDEADHIYKLGF